MDTELKQQVIQNAHTLWRTGKLIETGVFLYEHIPTEYRRRWGADILEFVYDYGSPSTEIEAVLDLATNFDKWGERETSRRLQTNRAVFKVGRLAYQAKEPLAKALFTLATDVAAVIYNAYWYYAPFKHSVGWEIVEDLKQVIKAVDDANFGQGVWSNLCPEAFIVAEIPEICNPECISCGQWRQPAVDLDQAWISVGERELSMQDCLNITGFSLIDYERTRQTTDQLFRPGRLNDKSKQQIIQKVQELWQTEKFLEAGGLLYERIPRQYRPRWATGLLKLASEYAPPAPEIEAILDLANEPDWRKLEISIWQKAHTVVDEVNERHYETQEPLAKSIFTLAMNIAKVTYNTYFYPAPFDHSGGWEIAANLKQVIKEVNNPDFAEKAWQKLCNEAFITAEMPEICNPECGVCSALLRFGSRPAHQKAGNLEREAFFVEKIRIGEEKFPIEEILDMTGFSPADYQRAWRKYTVS